MTEDKMHFVQFPDSVLIIKLHKALYFPGLFTKLLPNLAIFSQEISGWYILFYDGKSVPCFHKLHHRVNPQHVHPEYSPCLVINRWNCFWLSASQREHFKVWDWESFLSDFGYSPMVFFFFCLPCAVFHSSPPRTPWWVFIIVWVDGLQTCKLSFSSFFFSKQSTSLKLSSCVLK